MQRLEVSGAVRPIYGSLGVKRLSISRTSSAYTSATNVVKSTCFVDKNLNLFNDPYMFCICLIVCKISLQMMWGRSKHICFDGFVCENIYV